jgi:hypothetical protein
VAKNSKTMGLCSPGVLLLILFSVSFGNGARVVYPELTCEEIASLQGNPEIALSRWMKKICLHAQGSTLGGGTEASDDCPTMDTIQHWSCAEAQEILSRVDEEDFSFLKRAASHTMMVSRSISGSISVKGASIVADSFQRSLTRKSGSSSPSSCPAGQFKWIRCWYCPTGKYQPATGQETCLACPAGYYQDMDDGTATSCKSCPSGYYTTETSPKIDARTAVSKIGTAGVWHAKYYCVPHSCPTGYYGSRTQSVCQSCLIGKFSDAITGSAIASCKLCPQGKFQGATGQSSCEDCALGNWGVSYNSYIPSYSGGFSKCDKNCEAHDGCPVGYYQNVFWNTGCACATCASGKYQNELNQRGCKDCPTSYYQSSTGSTSCAYTGLYRVVNAGYFRYVTHYTSSATVCPNGKYQPSTNQVSCASCPAGYFGKTSSKTSCNWCPAGYYQHQSTQTTCTICSSNGRYQSLTGQTSCVNCPQGYYLMTGTYPVNTVCKSCPQGYYVTHVKADACVGCQIGTHAAPGTSICLFVSKPLFLWSCFRSAALCDRV